MLRNREWRSVRLKRLRDPYPGEGSSFHAGGGPPAERSSQGKKGGGIN